MSEETKVDKDYKEAFNLGYELAKELNLKAPMFKEINEGHSRMGAMQAGMAKYSNDMEQGQVNENVENFTLVKHQRIEAKKNKDKGNGLNQSI